MQDVIVRLSIILFVLIIIIGFCYAVYRWWKSSRTDFNKYPHPNENGIFGIGTSSFLKIVGAISAFFVILGVLISLVPSGDITSEEEKSNQNISNDIATSKIVKELELEKCTKLMLILGSSGVSSVQREEMSKNIEGLNVSWELTFVDVHEQALVGGYLAVFSCFAGPAGYVRTSVYYPSENKTEMLELMKGKSYIVSGKIKEIRSAIKFTTGAVLELESASLPKVVP